MQTLYNKKKSDYLKSRRNKWLFSFVEEEREENGVTYKSLNSQPDKDSYLKIEAVNFLVFDDDSEKIQEMPNFITKLPNLDVLSIPIDWLDSMTIPINIKALTLVNSMHLKDKYQWCENLLLKNLKYLSIPEQIKPFDIDFENVPNLEWIHLDLKAEKKEYKLSELSSIKTLKYLNFSQAKNFDIFTPFFTHNIEALELFSCTGKKFPIQNIKFLKNLKYIRINNIAVDFDCSWLLGLPNLIELELLNIRSVVNVNQLLEIDTLRSISITNCNNPFDNKDEFKSKEYDLLRIDYA